MHTATIIDFIDQSLWIALELALPPMIIGLVVGLIISAFQAMTQIQEASLSFVPKFVVMTITISLLLPNAMRILKSFTDTLSKHF